MPHYIVEIPATTKERMLIEAETPEEAIEKVADGDGQYFDNARIPDWDQDRNNWKAFLAIRKEVQGIATYVVKEDL